MSREHWDYIVSHAIGCAATVALMVTIIVALVWSLMR